MSTKIRIKMRKPTKYTDEFKESVIKEVLDGIITKEEAKRRYGIRGSPAVLICKDSNRLNVN